MFFHFSCVFGKYECNLYSREEEIAKYGKQIMFRTTTQKSKKVYDRKRLKKAGINSDDLPLMIFSSLAKKHSFL